MRALILAAALAPAGALGARAANVAGKVMPVSLPPLPAGVPSAVPRDPKTGLYGVNAYQLREIARLHRQAYGDNIVDLAAVGSRVTGQASAVKNFRPVSPTSDLDLVPLLRKSVPDNSAVASMREAMRALLGFSVEFHTAVSFDGRPFGYAVTFYGGGEESVLPFGSGALRLPMPSLAPVQGPLALPPRPKIVLPKTDFQEFYY